MLDLLRTPLVADDLIERARRQTGLGDFGGTPFRDGLCAFLSACVGEANLSLFGRLGTRWDVVRFLSNLLRLHSEEVKAPGILDQPIERPIFITGLPRSGTTFLHRILAEDPTNQVPRVWELIHPYPAARSGRSSDDRQRRVARQLRMFELLAPEFRSLHPINAGSPQECSEINAHIFASTRFDTTYFVPSYRRWLDDIGHLDAYRFHKRFLQHLQYQSGSSGRWVLKCPDHVFALAEIRAVYPDARVVFVHRDPLQVLPSLIRLTEVLRRPFSKHVDREALGRQESERWRTGVERMIGAAQEQPFAEPIFHVHHRSLIDEPLGTVENLYRHFGLTLDPVAAARISQMVAASPNGGYGSNRYSPEDYHINLTVERERYSAYTEYFGVEDPSVRAPVAGHCRPTPHPLSSGPRSEWDAVAAPDIGRI
jgi:hypothetical protein